MLAAPQLELNLGHNCNNRCVFCLCGQLTERGLAEPNPADRMRVELDRAVLEGVRRVTFLGGEPTLQPGFDELMAYAVTLGFEELTIFTNGARTGKRDFLERMTALGPFTWRFSIQGGDELTHDRNTLRPGSFKRIVHGLEVLQELGQRTTVNTCVNANNVDALPLFPALLARYGVVAFHADMVRPHSTGDRSDQEVASLVPDYARVRARFSDMMEGFERAAAPIDVRIGNLPFCVLPEFAPFIHHGGEFTWTVTGDGHGGLRDPLDKYDYQREQHQHPPACEGCVVRPRCKGVPDIMVERGDLALIRPVTMHTLRAVAPARRDLLAVVQAYLGSPNAAQAQAPADAPDRHAVLAVLPARDNRVEVRIGAPSGPATFVFEPPAAARALARSPDFSLSLKATLATAADTASAFGALVQRLERTQLSTIHVLLSGGELVEALMAPDQRTRSVLALRQALLRLRKNLPSPGELRLGTKHSLADAFGVGIRALDADGRAGQVRLVLGSTADAAVHVEFHGSVSAEAQRLVMAAVTAP